MSSFTFEYSERGEAPLFAETVDLPSRSAIWCHVEAMALRLGERPGAFIRVRDEKGQPVVRTGVATAIASIGACACEGCELKRIARGAKPPESVALAPCRSNRPCACGRRGGVTA
jgi:hypothetical protein